MAKSLIIVESPAKAKTISKYLGKDFQVKASVGHVKDLPKKELGVDVENKFLPRYEVIRGKQKVIQEIKKSAEKADKIYLAPDPDREGEAIAWHLAEEIKAKKGKVSRVLFHEITKKGIQAALKNSESLDKNRYEAQQSRRILDRLVGYQISPILWEKVKGGLSAGRVQSVALRIICEREKEVKAFVPEEYWSIHATLQGSVPPAFQAKLVKINKKNIDIKTEKEALKISDDLKKNEILLSKLTKKEKRRNPLPPFITSKLQQEAARRCRFSAKKTMLIAQQLYEGVELGPEGPEGLITYMRTDSARVSNDALQEVREVIKSTHGDEYLPKEPNVYKSKKSAQEAHEAIRPTLMDHPPEKLASFLNKDQLRLYTLIWERFLASQMTPALFEQTTFDMESGKYLLRATGSVLIFKGFLAAFKEETAKKKSAVEEEADEDGEKGKEAILPALSQGEKLKQKRITPKQHFTQAPPRFSESTLIKELEENGIGRPSTYASIVSTIQQKEYILKEKGFFQPSELGQLINDLLVENFPTVLDVAFTAKMEEQLDLVEEGKIQWVDLLKEFYDPFKKSIEQAKVKMRDVKREEIPTDVVCDRCKEKMTIRWGRNGQFLACSAYPKCRNTKDFTRKEDGKIEIIKDEEFEDLQCEECAKPMVVKRGRYGRFLACSGYPDCRNTKQIYKDTEGKTQVRSQEVTEEVCEKCGENLVVKRGRTGGRFLACPSYPKCKNIKPLKIGVPCPEEGCGGDIVERSSKRGRVFYGCSKYPECRFTSWDKPISAKCPQCDAPFLVERYVKEEGMVVRCSNKECDYHRPGRLT